jgi:hypothetical protein
LEAVVSIQNRLEDTKCLIEQGRYEGALTSLLIAVAATARKRFPKGVTPSIANPKKKMGDGESFETFVAQQNREITDVNTFSVEFEGRKTSLGGVLYSLLRCYLLHEGELSPKVEFVPDSLRGALSIVNDSGPPEKLIFSQSLVIFLADMVSRAAENADLSPEIRKSIMRLHGINP